MGDAYRDLPGEDKQAHLESALACYQAALEVYQSEHQEDDVQLVSGYLDEVQRTLQQLDREPQ